jgi:DNA repair protein RadC
MTLSEAVTDGTTCTLVDYASIQDDPLIRQAIGVLEERLFKRGASLTSPAVVCEYLRLKLAGEALEVFAAVFLDAQHCVIAYEPMFRGTIDGATVYPRAVVKRAIEHNCAAVIFAHNHPSGSTEPSQADKAITKRLKSALELVDVRVLDHFVIGDGIPFSFAEAGLL